MDRERLLDRDLSTKLDVAVFPYDDNPPSWRQRIPICLLAWLAVSIAAYRALYQWRLVDSVWDPVFGEQSQQVLDSTVAERMDAWIGARDAALRALAYLGDAVFGLAGSTCRWQCDPWLVILLGLDAIPLGIVSAVLVILQGTVEGSWCFLCLVTAAISLILVYMAYDEVFASIRYLHRVWRRTGSWRMVGRVFMGWPMPEAGALAAETVRSEAAGERFDVGARR